MTARTPCWRICPCRAPVSFLSAVGIVAVALLGALERLTFKAAVDASHGGRFFAAQALALVQLAPLVAVVVVKRLAKDERVVPTDKTMSLSQWSYAAMGALDMAQSQLLWVCSGALHAALVVAVVQAQLPFAIALSCALFCTRHGVRHVLGGVLVAIGVGAHLAPTVLAAVGIEAPLAVALFARSRGVGESDLGASARPARAAPRL